MSTGKSAQYKNWCLLKISISFSLKPMTKRKTTLFDFAKSLIIRSNRKWVINWFLRMSLLKLLWIMIYPKEKTNTFREIKESKMILIKMSVCQESIEPREMTHLNFFMGLQNVYWKKHNKAQIMTSRNMQYSV